MKQEHGNHPVVVVGLNPTALGLIRPLRRHGVTVVAVDSDFDDLAGKTRCSKKIPVESILTEGLVDQLIDIGKCLDARPLLTTTVDATVTILSEHRERLHDYFKLTLPSKSVVKTLMDKTLFADFARRKGYPIPRSFVARDEHQMEDVAEQISFPAIVKPYMRDERFQVADFGKAARVMDGEELSSRYSEIKVVCPDVVVQEWVPGPDSQIYFCLTYWDETSRCLAACTGRKLRQWPPRCGSTSLAVSCEEEQVKDITIDLFEDVGFKGFGSVEYKRDPRDGTLKIMEPTVGRVNLQSYLAVAAGVNIPVIAYESTVDSAGSTVREGGQRNGRKWLYEYHDYYAARFYVDSGELNYREWLKSLLGVRAFAIFDWRDLGPFRAFVFRTVRNLWRKIWK